MTTATMWQRIRAYLVDYIIMVAFGALLFATSSLLPAAWFSTPNRAQLSAFFLLTLPVVLYFALSEASTWHASVGKRVVGVRVTTVTGHDPTLRTTLLRNAIKFLPWEIAHTFIQHQPVWPEPVTIAGSIAAMALLVFFFGSAFLSPNRQTMWDRVAQTRIVAA